MNKILAPKWLQREVEVYNRHLESINKINKRIAEYFERIDYYTDTGWDGTYRIKIVSGEIIEQGGKEYLKVEGAPLASSNRDGVYCHQICQFEDNYSGELYIPCSEGKYIQVHFDM